MNTTDKQTCGQPVQTVFLWLAAVILFVLAVAELSSAAGSARLLEARDPLIFVSNRWMLALRSALQLALSGFLLAGRGTRLKLVVTAWLAGAFTLWRAGLSWQKAPDPCSCLGNLTDAIPIRPAVLSVLMAAILTFLLGGSCICLVCRWLGLAAALPVSPPQPSAPAEPRGPGWPCVGGSAGQGHWRQLCCGWLIAAALTALLGFGLHARAVSSLPGRFETMLEEIISVGTFHGAPAASQDGTKLLYARETKAGLGIFLRDLGAGRSRRIGLVGEVVQGVEEYFSLVGWSPDGRYLAFSLQDAAPTLMVYDENGLRLQGAYSLLGELRQAVWLTKNSLLLMVPSHQLYRLDIRAVNPFQQLPAYAPASTASPAALARISEDRVAYGESGNVWSLQLSNAKTSQVTQLTNGTLRWLDYSPANGEFLFCSTDLTDPHAAWHRYLYRFNPNSPVKSGPIRLTDTHTFKGQWVDGGRSIAYVGTKDTANFLAVESEQAEPSTNLFSGGGHVQSYSVSPAKDKLYAVASLGPEPMGIWEYDIAGRKLRNVVPGLGRPFTAGRIIVPLERHTTNTLGDSVPYYILSPCEFEPGKKHPAVIDHPSYDRYDAGPQFLANAGILYASVNRRGLASFEAGSPSYDDILAIYADLLRDPRVDPRRIYLAGTSGGTGDASRLVDGNPEMWRGVLLLSPTAFPHIPSQAAKYPDCFVSIGGHDARAALEATRRFELEACRRLVKVKVVYHPGAGHNLNSTLQLKERYGAMARFILVP